MALIFINKNKSEISPNLPMKFNRLVGTVLTSTGKIKEINESQGSTVMITNLLLIGELWNKS